MFICLNLCSCFFGLQVPQILGTRIPQLFTLPSRFSFIVSIFPFLPNDHTTCQNGPIYVDAMCNYLQNSCVVYRIFFFMIMLKGFYTLTHGMHSPIFVTNQHGVTEVATKWKLSLPDQKVLKLSDSTEIFLNVWWPKV